MSIATATACKAKNPATCRYHVHSFEEIIAAWPSIPKGVSEEVARNHEAREIMRKQEFSVEWRERSDDWKQHGFQYPISYRKAEGEIEYLLKDREAVESLTSKQAHAIRFFSSQNYKWVSAALYGKTELPENKDARSIFEFNLKNMTGHDIEQNPSREQLNELTETLDEALAYKHPEARIVYRGKKKTDLGLSTTEELHDYVTKHYPVGGEVKFESYLSSSPSPKVAVAYSEGQHGTPENKEGIVFELKTRHGINITSAAVWSHEAETLLPRNTRWKVAAVHKGKSMKYEIAGTYGPSRKGFQATLIQLVEIED